MAGCAERPPGLRSYRRVRGFTCIVPGDAARIALRLRGSRLSSALDKTANLPHQSARPRSALSFRRDNPQIGQATSPCPARTPVALDERPSEWIPGDDEGPSETVSRASMMGRYSSERPVDRR